MFKIEFEYKDNYGQCGNWHRQSCVVNSLQDAINIYGLGHGRDYRIISITVLMKIAPQTAIKELSY